MKTYFHSHSCQMGKHSDISFPLSLGIAIFFLLNICATANAKILLPDTLSREVWNNRSLVDIQEDSLMSSHKVIYIDGRPTQTTQEHLDSMRRLISTFYYDQFRHSTDPAAPYFLFMSKDASLAMGMGGCVRMRGWYDWGGAIPANGFMPYLVPMTLDPTNMRKFGTTPSGSTLFFRVIGRKKNIGNYQIYIEANFNGWEGLGFYLKKAYATINDFTIGYAPSTFSDPASLPPTVDAAGPNNKLAATSVLLRWMHTIKNRWTIAASLETPATLTTAQDNLTAKVSDWLPDAAIFGQYEWGPTSHIRLAAIIRTLSYRNLVEQKNHTLPGWGVQLSSVSHPHRALTLYTNFCAGKGYEGLGGDLQIGTYDLIPKSDNPAQMYAPYAFGANVGLQYNILPNLFISTTYSANRYLPKGAQPDWEYKFGQFVAANIFWNITPRIQTGIEYDWAQRKNMDNKHRHAQRFGAVAQFAF